MIAAGGLGGGISASISGGNFWKGMRQGLITAGLNHVAHSVTNAIENSQFKRQIKDRIAENCGEDYLDQPVTENILQDLAAVFPEIFEASAKDYAIANKDNLFSKMVLTGDALFHGGNLVNGVTNMDNSKVLISPHLLRKDVLSFAVTWYHESIHSIHVVSGFYMKTYQSFINNGYSINDALRAAADVSEILAHFRTRVYSIGFPFEKSQDSIIRGYSSGYLNYLNLK